MAARMSSSAPKTEKVDAPVRKRRPRVRARVLAEDLTIREAVALRESLLEALEAGGPVRLDGRPVAMIDTAGLQLLAALAGDLRLEGRELKWTGVSQALRDAVERMGLTETLGIDA
jgi:anti-anti-sigma regulatory factor